MKTQRSLYRLLFLFACAAFIISALSWRSLLGHLPDRTGQSVGVDSESITLKYLLWASAALGGMLAALGHCTFLRLKDPGREYSRRHVLLLIPGVPIAVLSLVVARQGIAPGYGYYYTYSALRCSYLVLLSAPVGLYLVGIGLFPLPSRSPSLSPIALGSLVFALCGAVPGTPSAYVGFALGLVALLRIQRSKGKLRGDRYAAAGAILSALIIVAYWTAYWYRQ